MLYIRLDWLCFKLIHTILAFSHSLFCFSLNIFPDILHQKSSSSVGSIQYESDLQETQNKNERSANELQAIENKNKLQGTYGEYDLPETQNDLRKKDTYYFENQYFPDGGPRSENEDNELLSQGGASTRDPSNDQVSSHSQNEALYESEASLSSQKPPSDLLDQEEVYNEAQVSDTEKAHVLSSIENGSINQESNESQTSSVSEYTALSQRTSQTFSDGMDRLMSEAGWLKLWMSLDIQWVKSHD